MGDLLSMAAEKGGQTAGGLMKLGIGYFQGRKAKKLLKGLQYPTQSIPTAIKENKLQAELDAASGMPSEQYNLAMKNFQRNQLAGLRAGMDRNAGVGLIAALNDNLNTATSNLDAKSADMRLRNKRNLQDVNNIYGGWQDRTWRNNVKDKYDRDYNYAMSLKGAGNQNMIAGADALLSMGSGSGNRRKKEEDNTMWTDSSNYE